MPPPAEPCVACEIVAGRVAPVGGTLFEDADLHLHGVAAGTPVAGWVVLTTKRHLRCLADLDDATAARVGALAARVQRLQQRVLGAEIAYAVSLGEAVPHFHLHLIPRYADTPAHVRGPRVFQASPADLVADDAQARAVARLRDAFAASRPDAR